MACPEAEAEEEEEEDAEGGAEEGHLRLEEDGEHQSTDRAVAFEIHREEEEEGVPAAWEEGAADRRRSWTDKGCSREVVKQPETAGYRDAGTCPGADDAVGRDLEAGAAR